LPPGAGHATYIEAMERLVLPQLHAFQPDAIIVACGFDASAVDPLGRMLATSDTFRQMTDLVMQAAADLCGGRLTLVHEGGYSEVHVPFCGHAVLEQMSGTQITAGDPLTFRTTNQQPGDRFQRYCSVLLAEMEEALGL
jgi:acetoin utilization deacetylase AcuC-like enzyme